MELILKIDPVNELVTTVTAHPTEFVKAFYTLVPVAADALGYDITVDIGNDCKVTQRHPLWWSDVIKTSLLVNHTHVIGAVLHIRMESECASALLKFVEDIKSMKEHPDKRTNYVGGYFVKPTYVQGGVSIKSSFSECYSAADDICESMINIVLQLVTESRFSDILGATSPNHRKDWTVIIGGDVTYRNLLTNFKQKLQDRLGGVEIPVVITGTPDLRLRNKFLVTLGRAEVLEGEDSLTFGTLAYQKELDVKSNPDNDNNEFQTRQCWVNRLPILGQLDIINH